MGRAGPAGAAKCGDRPEARKAGVIAPAPPVRTGFRTEFSSGGLPHEDFPVGACSRAHPRTRASAEDATPPAWDVPTFDATTALRESRVAPRVTERDDALARSMNSSR